MSKIITFFTLLVFFSCNVCFAQCCGGTSPIAGGGSQGVLKENQLEISSYYKYLSSDITKEGDTLAPFTIWDKIINNYLCKDWVWAD